MKASEAIAIALHPRMTPDAVRVTLYYASLGAGEHPYDRDTLRELLEEGGDKRIRRALQRAERCGFLTRHHGGQQTDRFSFSASPAAGENVSQAAGALEKDVSASEAAGESDASRACSLQGGNNTSPSSPSSGANDPDPDLAALRNYLGAHADAVDRFARSAQHGQSWPGAIWGCYKPSGTQETIFGDLTDEQRPAALAAAMSDYAATGQAFRGQLFRGFLGRAIGNQREPDSVTRRSTGTYGRGRDPPRSRVPQRSPDPSEYEASTDIPTF